MTDDLKHKTYTKNRYLFDVCRVIDGDTVEGIVDLGFHTSITIHVRLAGYNAHELRGGTSYTKQMAKRESEFLGQLMRQHYPLYITATKKRSFTRWVGELHTLNGVESINSIMATYVKENTPVENIEG